MSIRLFSIAAALAGAVAVTASGAEARVHHGEGAGAGDRPTLAKNFKAKSKRGHAYRAKGKRYAKSGKSRRHASGGTSRSCLQPQARALLNRIESQFGPVSIVSTCRPGAVIATSGKPSKHRHGLAIDFDAGSRKGAIVSWLRKNHHSGDTMTYRDMSHIHVDIGPRFVSLGSHSRRG